MHTGRMIPLQGFEKLRLQGMWIGESLEYSCTDSDLAVLAGNAFDVFCCSVVTMAAFAVLGAEEMIDEEMIADDSSSSSISRHLDDYYDKDVTHSMS